MLIRTQQTKGGKPLTKAQMRLAAKKKEKEEKARAAASASASGTATPTTTSSTTTSATTAATEHLPAESIQAQGEAEIVAYSEQSRFHSESFDANHTDIDIKGVNISIGAKDILVDAHLRLKTGVKYGMVGQNGVGKSGACNHFSPTANSGLRDRSVDVGPGQQSPRRTSPERPLPPHPATRRLCARSYNSPRSLGSRCGTCSNHPRGTQYVNPVSLRRLRPLTANNKLFWFSSPSHRLYLQVI